jgi:hypothetical protein
MLFGVQSLYFVEEKVQQSVVISLTGDMTELVRAILVSAGLIRASAHDCPCGGGWWHLNPSFVTSDRRAVSLTGLGFKASSFKPCSFGTTHHHCCCHWLY